MNPEKPAAPPSGPGTRPLDKREIFNIGADDSLPGCLGERRPIFPNVCETCDVGALCEQMRRESAQKR